jgi:hypothetical protein
MPKYNYCKVDLMTFNYQTQTLVVTCLIYLGVDSLLLPIRDGDTDIYSSRFSLKQGKLMPKSNYCKLDLLTLN